MSKDASSGQDRLAWIDVIAEAEAAGRLADAYDEYRSPQTGMVDNVLKIHSLHPETMHDHARLYRTLMHGKGGLLRPEREMIGVVVSVANECHY